MLALSSEIQQDLIAAGRTPDSTLVAPWGPDLNFHGYNRLAGDSGRVVASGKTHRDFRTLLTAAKMAGAEVTIHSEGVRETDAGANVRLISRAPYSAVMADMAAAAVICIPLDPAAAGTFGLTELNDALALGKPVIITRNCRIDLDIEEEGCGRIVDAGDPKALAVAIGEILRSDALRRDMGARARQVAETQWNQRLFGGELLRAVRLATANDRERS